MISTIDDGITSCFQISRSDVNARGLLRALPSVVLKDTTNKQRRLLIHSNDATFRFIRGGANIANSDATELKGFTDDNTTKRDNEAPKTDNHPVSQLRV